MGGSIFLSSICRPVALPLTTLFPHPTERQPIEIQRLIIQRVNPMRKSPTAQGTTFIRLVLSFPSVCSVNSAPKRFECGGNFKQSTQQSKTFL